MSKKTHYAVRKGHTPGIYTSWGDCKKQINGFSGAEFKGFDNESHAQAWYNGIEPDKPLDYPTKGVTCDAWTSGNPGLGGCRVTDLKGNTLVEWNAKTPHTNNFFELMGLALAIKYALQHGIKTVWCDSQSAISWAQSNKPRGKELKLKYKILNNIKNLYEAYPDKAVFLEKWKTDEWGEIPADYNRK